MADTTPRLSVTAETTPYAPYSFLAVAAIAAAGFFAVTFVLLRVSAWLADQPLFEPVLLLLPLVALVLAFAGRRHVLNSEGTRVGLQLCNLAWWISVIFGVVYLANLVGVGFSVRSDAEDAFQRWSATVAKANPTDPRSVDLAAAFHGTLPPEKQASISANDTTKLTTLHGTPLIAFKQSDLMRLVYRNAKEATFDVVGLEDWKQEANALECRLTVHVNCPEGQFSMSLPMKKQTLKGQTLPTWQVVPPQNDETSFFRLDKPPRLSAYGERIRDMEIAARHLVYSYFLTAVGHRGHQSRVFEVFGSVTDPQKAVEKLQGEAIARMALVGGSGWDNPAPADAYATVANKHFVPLEKGDPVRDDENRKKFAACWKAGFFSTPNAVIQKNPDVGFLLVPGENAWEIRVPIEIQTPGTERSQAAARGVVVCRVDDPAFLKELADLKANSNELHDAKARFSPEKPVPWKVVRIESDMKLVIPPRQGPGGGPGE